GGGEGVGGAPEAAAVEHQRRDPGQIVARAARRDGGREAGEFAVGVRGQAHAREKQAAAKAGRGVERAGGEVEGRWRGGEAGAELANEDLVPGRRRGFEALQ